MSKHNQLEQLRKMLDDPKQQSGLYLIDTDLSDEEIEAFIKQMELCHYVKEVLIPAKEGNSFELFMVGLSHKCNDDSINKLRDQFLPTEGGKRETFTYSLLIQIIKYLCPREKSVVHVCGRIDFSSLPLEDLYTLEAALAHHDEKTIFVISKQKSIVVPKGDTIIRSKSLKEIDRYRIMENRLKKVHISYKHDENYSVAIESIKNGLTKNGIEYSIDEHDIEYRDNIEDYEKEIGQAERVIMFLTPAYLKSLACMFEMAQIFENGNIRERIFPIVDMGAVKRDGDGLSEIKSYWLKEKKRKVREIEKDSGGSNFHIKEIEKVGKIISCLDDFWGYIVDINTEDLENLTKDDASLLVAELKKSVPQVVAYIDEKFVPTNDTKPNVGREVIQHGGKSLYIENNTGSITIN